MAIVAVMVASFSLREQEPNPYNQKLAEEALRICEELVADGYTPALAVQWEVDLALQHYGTTREGTLTELIKAGAWPYEVIGLREDGGYLGTKEVFREARLFFRSVDAKYFVAVANPFLHQPYSYWLAHNSFELLWRRVAWIGFDKLSTQPWCRSWWQLLAYTVKVAFGKHGYNNRQVKA